MPTVEIVHDFWVLGNPIVVVAGVGNVCCYLVCARLLLFGRKQMNISKSPQLIFTEKRESHSH